jgi:hypothetical protein
MLYIFHHISEPTCGLLAAKSRSGITDLLKETQKNAAMHTTDLNAHGKDPGFKNLQKKKDARRARMDRVVRYLRPPSVVR